MTADMDGQSGGPSPEPVESARLDVDLAALCANYNQLRDIASTAECAAVVKADAYGLGAHRVAPSLLQSGCRSFFVATPAEGIELRGALRSAEPDIFILDGLFFGTEAVYLQHRLTPVLGSLEGLDGWRRFAEIHGEPLPAALHIDTGMNRLGLGSDTFPEFLQKRAQYERSIRFELAMSHLACGDEPDHPRNRRQLDLFRAALSELSPVRASLANSAGIVLGKDYHFDLVRPGIALYGGRAVNTISNPMRPVAHLTAPIMQVRTVSAGDSIGYGASYTAERDRLIATAPVGYADGYHRALGGKDGTGAKAYIGGHPAPLAGRVSMDLITIDVTEIPASLVYPGASVELIGENVTVDDLADVAGTIGYEILTSLGKRYARHYRDV